MPETELKDRQFLEEKVSQLLEEIERLRQEMARLKKLIFGPKREKVDPAQLHLDFVPEEETPPPFVEEAPDEETAPAKKRKSRRNGRAPLPENLPRQRIEHHPDPEELICPCCEGEKERIGEEVTEELDYIPASVFVTEHVRVKYACRKCEEGVVLGELPPRPIEKGRPGPGLLAHVVTSKYGDHLPLARQEGILARHGVSIARSTLCDWVRDVAALLEPIAKEMRRGIMASGLVQTDDTPVRVRTGMRETRRGAIWCYLSPEVGEVVYDFTPNRARDGPERILEGFEGWLQADAYAGYNRIVSKEGVTEVGCWAHARRKFYEALETAPDEASTVMVGIFGVSTPWRPRRRSGTSTSMR
jgi:transposase